MSQRSIGGANLWDTATWGAAAPDPPYNSTWSGPTATNDLPARLAQDPDASQGASASPSALGALRFVVQILNPALNGTALWDTAVWNTATWPTTVGNWQDLSSRIRGVSWDVGELMPNDRARVGTADLTLNNLDGLVSPWATSGAFTAGSRSWIRAGALVRFGMLYTNADVLPVGLDPFNAFFTGKIESLDEGSHDNVDSWVTLHLVETTVDLGAVPADLHIASGRGLTEQLFHSLMQTNWPYQVDMSVPTDDARTCEALLSGISENEQLQLLADGKHWDVLADGRGRVEVVRRRVSDVKSGITFSNAPAGAEMPIVGINPFSSIDRVLNYISAARLGGTPQVINDGHSQTQFGTIAERYGFPRDDLVLETDAMVLALARLVMSLRAWDDLGIDTFELNMDQDPVNLPAVMSYIATRAREAISFAIRYKHPSGSIWNEVVVIEGQHHDLTMEGNQLLWTCVLTTGHAGPASGTG